MIFLDVDGVLNSQQTRVCELKDGSFIRDDLPAPHLVTNLRRIVRETGAQIVLSSTWRLCPRSTEQLRQRLKANGLCFASLTEDLSTKGDRVDEIYEWLSRHPQVS